MEAPRWQHPYTVQLDPDTARTLTSNGATILLLDVPEATPIGLDQQVRVCECFCWGFPSPCCFFCWRLAAASHRRNHHNEPAGVGC